MKRLILMRHAKSDWSASGDDHSRPLNKRGKASAPAMGRWICARGWTPQEVWCSSATRTRQTCDLLGFEDAKRHDERALYLAEAKIIFGILKMARSECVLLVGHNHGIADCAHQLVSRWPDHVRFPDYPTCATSLVTCDIENWSDLAPGKGHITDFAVPREVLAAQS